MNRLFVEAKHENTSECNFLKSIIRYYFHDKEGNMEFVFMNGFGNLFNETILNQIKSSIDNDDRCIAFLDADTCRKGGGFDAKSKWLADNKKKHGVEFPVFLYPDNSNNGDVECLMEHIARRDLHKCWFDCFEDYEKCVLGIKNSEGNNIYNIPNLKGKLHTYISSMNLSSKEKSKIGSGNWLFENENYWNLKSKELIPLIEFLRTHLL